MNNRNAMVAGIVLFVISTLLSVVAIFKSAPPLQVADEIAFAPTAEIQIASDEKPFPENRLPGKNPFDPFRGEPPPVEAETENAATAKPAGKPLPRRNDFKLTGIFGYGNERGALITTGRMPGTPGAKTGKNRFKIGDMVGDDFVLTEISAKSVTLKRGDETLTLSLLPKKQEKAP